MYIILNYDVARSKTVSSKLLWSSHYFQFYLIINHKDITCGGFVVELSLRFKSTRHFVRFIPYLAVAALFTEFFFMYSHDMEYMRNLWQQSRRRFQNV